MYFKKAWRSVLMNTAKNRQKQINYLHMSKLQIIRFIFPVIVLFLSCEQKVKETANELEMDVEQAHENTIPNDVLQMVEDIEDLCDAGLQEVRHLPWEYSDENDPKYFQVTSFLDHTGTPFKIVEEYSFGGKAMQEGKKTYYFENGKVFAYYHQYDKWFERDSVKLFDEQHFYDLASGKSIASRFRSAYTIDDLPFEEWKSIETTTPDVTTTQAIINEDAPFETHFLSYVESDYGLFIVLGEPKDYSEARYQTTVVANPDEPFIQDLLRNKERYKFQKLSINYTFQGGGANAMFTVLQSAEWVK
jgi:hypothetical protein